MNGRKGGDAAGVVTTGGGTADPNGTESRQRPLEGRNGTSSWRTARRSRLARWARIPDWLISVVGGLLLWELAIQVFQPSALFLSSPSEVVVDLYDILASGYLWPHFWLSMQGFGGGMAVAIVVGIPLGLLMGVSRNLRRFLDPWVNGLYSTPAIALAPLFVLWLGFGVAKTAGVVFLLAVFPIVINTMDGVLRVGKDLKDVAAAFEATRVETVTKVLFPGSTGYILTSIRLAIGRGVVGVVVADLFGASAGLGFIILEAARVFNSTRIFTATVILAVVGVVLSELVRLIERRWARWLEG